MKKILYVFITAGLILGLLPKQVFAQKPQVTVTGTVVNEKNETIPGATVAVKGTTTGTITSADGAFSVKAASDAVLSVSFIGFKSIDVPVNGKNNLKITLKEDNKLMEEVVVVGYGTQKRVNLTGAVATIDIDKTLASRPITDLGRGLQGSSPGLMITTSSGNIGTAPQIHLRGIDGSINADSAPLILLDNVEIPNMMMVNPADVESISILKDAASASIYGARGSWGVILITTKKGTKGKVHVSYDNNFAWSSPMNLPVVADGAEGVEYMLKEYRRTAPNTASYSVLGAYYDDLSIDRINQWKKLYGGMDLGPDLVEGRDFERRNGQTYFYRPFNIEQTFLNDAAPEMKHNLSISGGDDKTTYFASFGMLDQHGLVKVAPAPDKYVRFNGTMRVETKVNDWFTARGSLMSSNSRKQYPNFRLANGAAANEYWFNVFRYPETYPYGTFNGIPLKSTLTELQQAHMNSTESEMNRLQLGSTITFMKGWTADVDYTYAGVNSHDNVATSPISGINSWADPTLTKLEANFFPAEDYTRERSDWSKRQVGKAYTTYNKQIKEHSLKLMAGTDIEYYENRFQYSQANGLMLPSKPELNLTTGTQFADGYPTHWSTLGFFGRLNYSFKDKYLFEANIRQDGSSRFPVNKKWGTFPSFSAGYILTSEKYMDAVKEATALSFMKIRASWGSIGNNNVGSSYLRTMSAGNSNWWIGTLNPTSVGVFGNVSSDLTWETVETTDLGLNAKFFDNALDIEIDGFSRVTKGMVTSGIELPSTLGASPSRRNFGELTTRGWELSVGYNKQFSNGFGFDIKGSLSDAVGEITKFAADKAVNVQAGGSDIANYTGKKMGEIWGYTTDRLFTADDFDGNNGAANPTWNYKTTTPNQDALNTASSFHYGPGDVKYKDLNGDGVVNYGKGTNEDHGDMHVIGNETPRYIYGLRIGLNYKGFDFSAFAQGVGKRDYWATGAVFIPGWVKGEAVYQNQMDYWTPENPNAYWPTPSDPGGNNHNADWQPQTRYLLNMAYLRMKNITIGYTIPQSITKKCKISRARVFASGENLFTLDHLNIMIDPEIQQNSVEGFNDAKSFARTYPYFRTLSCGVQIDL